MNERELTIDDLSSPYDEESVAMFSYGGPVGEEREDDEEEEQPSVQYFAQGGEVEEAQAILTRIPPRPMPTMATSMPKPGRAAQMLQSFAEGGEVQKTPFPELLDISKQVNAAGAPVEKLATPTVAPASTPVSSQINIPTFQPAAPVPTGPNIITPTPAPLAGLGAPPSLTQPTAAPTTTARSLFEQINPATMAAMPTYTTPSFTPTAQTFTKPTLLTPEELQKAQPKLVRYEPSATYGGLETYKGPLQTSPYTDIPGAPSTGGGGTTPQPVIPVNVTPGGYKYTTYTSLTPDQLVGLGDKAQLGQTFAGIVKRQQDDATAIRAEFNNAIASGDMERVALLRPILAQKDADVRQAISDQGMAGRYFTGTGGAFETPEQYRQRMLTAQLQTGRLGPELTSVSLEGLQYKLPETNVKGAVPTPFASQLNTQKGEYDAALTVYNNLVKSYGKDNPFVKSYFEEIVTPQKKDYDLLLAKPVTAAATTADKLLSDPALKREYAPPKLSPTFKVSNTMAAFKNIVGGLETSVRQLTTARDNATKAGLTGYAAQLDEAISTQQGKLDKALDDRRIAVENSLPDPVKRAMGSPPEGEVADTRSRALLKKLSGGSEANTVPLQKFGKGGAVNKAQESPVKGETVPTPPPPSAKDQVMSGIVSEASKLLKNITGKSAPDTTLNMSQYEQMYALKDVGSPEKGRKAALNVYSSLLPALMRARFPDYVANSPAKVLKEGPRGAQNVGEFDVFYRTIALDPEGTNSMLMEPYGKYGYIGMGSNTTTDETLNALGTMLHESMHARTRGAEGKKRSAPHPVEQLKKAMPKDRFDEMIRDIRVSDLPSVYSAPNPAEVINEYFATATPVKHMVDKDMVTKRSRRYLAEVDRLAKKYPELEKMRVTWERPELFFKD